MITYWKQLTDRDQKILAAGAVTLLSFLLYALILSPIIKAKNNQTKILQEKQETLQWMQHTYQQFKTVKTQQIISCAKLLTLIDSQLSQSSFKQFPYQLKQTGPNEIQLTYAQVPFNLLMDWAWTLSNHYAIQLKQVNIGHSDTAGIVSLNLIMSITP